jgi:hypothetical protein
VSFILARLQYNFEDSWQIFEKTSYIYFHENPSKRNWFILWTDRQTDMTELIVVSLNFVSSSGNVHLFHLTIHSIFWAKLRVLCITVLYINLMTFYEERSGKYNVCDCGWNASRVPTLSVELTRSVTVATNQLREAPKRAYIGLEKLQNCCSS